MLSLALTGSSVLNPTETARGPRSSPKLRGPCLSGLPPSRCQIGLRGPGEPFRIFALAECWGMLQFY